MISHEATILKAAVLCDCWFLPTTNSCKTAIGRNFGKEEQENCFQDFETLLLKRYTIFYHRFSFTEDVHVLMINAELIPMIKPNRQGKKQNEAQLLLSLVWPGALQHPDDKWSQPKQKLYTKLVRREEGLAGREIFKTAWKRS